MDKDKDSPKEVLRLERGSSQWEMLLLCGLCLANPKEIQGANSEIQDSRSMILKEMKAETRGVGREGKRKSLSHLKLDFLLLLSNTFSLSPSLTSFFFSRSLF